MEIAIAGQQDDKTEQVTGKVTSQSMDAGGL